MKQTPNNILKQLGLLAIIVLSYIFDNSDPNVSQAWVQFIPLAISGVSALTGLAQRNKASNLENQNRLPQAQISTDIAKNQALANALAKQGLPAPVYNNQLNQMQQGLATGLRQQGSRGVGGINANAFLRTYNQGLGNLNAQDAQAQMSNQRLAMQMNSQMAQEQNRVWNWNQAQPFLRNSQNIAQLRQAGNQNLISGVAGAGQALMMQQYFSGNSTAGGLGNPFINASMYGQGQGMVS